MTGLLCAVFLKSYSQELTVGDSMPDLKGLRFFKDGKYSDIDLKFSQIKDKLIIFDFWAPWCGPCIAGLPKMDSLQKKFGDKIMILPIVGWKKILDGAKIYDIEKYISEFWMKNSYTKRSTSLGTLVEGKNDKALYKYFPNAGLPHEVWVMNGKVIGITSSEYVNEVEINSILSGNQKNWAIAGGSPKGKSNKYDYTLPLLVYAYGAKVTALPEKSFYNQLSGYIDGFLESKKDNLFDKNRMINKVTFINHPILRLYKEAVIEPMEVEKRNTFRSNNRTILEIKDSVNYFNTRNEYRAEWEKAHTYSYEAVLPAIYNQEAVFNYMREDLNRLFNLNGRLEKRKVNCWVITRNSDDIKAPTGLQKQYAKNEEIERAKFPPYEYDLKKSKDVMLRGWYESIYQNIKGVMDALNTQSVNCPVLDESGYTGELEFLLRFGPKISFKDYQKQLAKNGFYLKVAERELEMLVLTENGFKPSKK